MAMFLATEENTVCAVSARYVQTLVATNEALSRQWFEMVRKFFSELDASPKTARMYGTALKQYTVFVDGAGLPFGARASVLAWKDSLKAMGRKPNSVNLYLSALRKFSHFCKLEGFEDFADGVKSLKIPSGFKRDWLNGVEMQFCEKTVRSEWQREPRNPAKARNYAMFILAGVLGLRVMEISGLNVSDVCGGFLWVSGKKQDGSKQRVNAPKLVLDVLGAYMKLRGLGGNEDGALFVSHSPKRVYTNERLSVQTISHILKGILRRSGFDSPNITAHSLRHSAITLAYKRQKELGAVDALAIQQFARHSDFGTTVKNYIHACDSLENKCCDLVASAVVAPDEAQNLIGGIISDGGHGG